jgi:cyclophilin family peptidyl-prolyl cis-trans isomerase
MNRVLVRCVLASAAIAAAGFLAVTAEAGTVVRFDTNYSVNGSSGPISSFDVELYDAEAPITVANFLKYVNAGLYNDTIIHRDAKDFVAQGGGFTPATVNGTVTALNPITTFPPIQNEFSTTRSNLVGTLAMAKLGGDPNSATSQWFVNLGDNSANLDNQNGGFTVFAKVLGEGMTLINAINSLPQADLSSQFGGAFTEVPKISSGNSAASFVTITKAAVYTPPVVGSLSGAVYFDANHNGIRDALDYAIAGAQVTLTKTGSSTPVATVRSGTNGSYEFGNLAAGTYSIAMQTPTTMPGQDNGSQQILLDKNGSVLKTGNIGAGGQNVWNNVTLGTDQSGQNIGFAEAAYPAALMSARMLLNDSPGMVPYGAATSTSLVAADVAGNSAAVPSGGGSVSTSGGSVSAVPEPGTLALLAAGGMFLGGFAWRRRNGR